MSQQLISANELNSTSKPTFAGLYTTGSISIGVSSTSGQFQIGNTSPLLVDSNNNLLLGTTTSPTINSANGSASINGTGLYGFNYTNVNQSTGFVVNNSTYYSSVVVNPTQTFTGASSLANVGFVSVPTIIATATVGSTQSSAYGGFFAPSITSSTSTAYVSLNGITVQALRTTPNDNSTNSSSYANAITGSAGHGAYLPSTSSSNIATGITGQIINYSGTIGTAIGIRSSFQFGNSSSSQTNTTTSASLFASIGFTVGAATGATSTVTTGYGINIPGPTVAATGTMGTYYGLYLGAATVTGTLTTRYGIYQADTAATNVIQGTVGIGTSSPSYTLDVQSSAALGFNLRSVGSGTAIYQAFYQAGGLAAYLGVENSSGAGILGTGAAYATCLTTLFSSPLAFGTNGTEKMRLDTSGNLGLGVTPSAWSLGKAVEVGNTGNSIWGAAAGNFIFLSNAYYNSGYKYAATGTATYYQQYSGQHQWAIAASGTAGNAISFTQAMTLDNSGNLMLGTTTQQGRLHVSQNGVAARFTRTNNTDQYIEINGGDGAGVSTINANYTMALSTGGTERARIDTSGNFGIGTTSPSSALYVKRTSGNSGIYTDYNGTNVGRLEAASNGNLYMGLTTGSGSIGLGVTSNANAVLLDSSGNFLIGTTSALSNPTTGITFLPASGASNAGIGHVSGTASGSGYWYFAYNGSNIGSITQSGTTAVLYNTTSDQRLKENIVDAESASSLIDAIQVRQFDWKSDGSHQRYGFIAQELVTVAPEAVHQPEDPEEMMAVDYSKLVPMLVKAIQELKSELDIVKTELAALKS